jgi:hypothetical protein
VPLIFNPALVESLKWHRKMNFWHFEGISRMPIPHPLMELGKTGGAMELRSHSAYKFHHAFIRGEKQALE